MDAQQFLDFFNESLQKTDLHKPPTGCAHFCERLANRYKVLHFYRVSYFSKESHGLALMSEQKEWVERALDHFNKNFRKVVNESFAPQSTEHVSCFFFFLSLFLIHFTGCQGVEAEPAFLAGERD